MNTLFTADEVGTAIASLKNNKAPGKDGIPPEFYKTLGEILNYPLLTLFNYVLTKQEYPQRWAEGINTLIHKKGSILNPDNYRRLTVQSVLAKCLKH